MTQQLGAWLDMLFGVKQQDPQKQNVFFSFASPKYMANAANRKKVDALGVTAVREFMQLPL